MTTPAALTADQASQLVNVRVMLEHALTEATAAPFMRRATAIVLLDAVVERATHLVAVTRGVPVARNDGLDELISKVKQDMGESWQPTVLSDIRQLRRARNAAQHEGLPPAGELVPSWATAARTYVRDLIDAQFGVDVTHVVLTIAVQDDERRAALEQAMQLVDGGDYAGAVAVATIAFKESQRQWHRLQSSGGLSIVSPGQSGELAVEVAELSALARDGALAPDGQEYLWFRGLIREQGNLIDEGEARRAVAFVFWWVIRLEAALSTWEPDRRARRDRAQRHVRTGAGPASIADATSTPDRGRVLLNQSGSATPLPDRWLLTFTLRDVPAGVDYSTWAECIRELLSHPPARSRWEVRQDGTTRVEVLDEAEIPARVDELRSALSRAELVLDEQARQSAEIDAGSEAEGLAYLEALASAGPLPEWVLAVNRAGLHGEEVVLLALDDSLRIPASADSVPTGFGGHRETLVDRIHAFLRAEDAAGSCYYDGQGNTAVSAVEPQRLFDLLNATGAFVDERLKEHASRVEEHATLDIRIEETLNATLQAQDEM
ncbi:hypothetical protein [Pengzhenrongella phosphoraccumulans]|uniref:hypothetical protein n=1 Tax=Pengzhenrongella phosphoraccumulans TaxID=3114394 RepID=UPI003890615A